MPGKSSQSPSGPSKGAAPAQKSSTQGPSKAAADLQGGAQRMAAAAQSAPTQAAKDSLLGGAARLDAAAQKK